MEAWLGESSQFREYLFAHREKGLFLSVYVDDFKNWLARNTNIDPMWNVLYKQVDLGRGQHHSLIMFTWDVLKDNGETSKDIAHNDRTMFESRIFAGSTEKTTKLGKTEYFYVVQWYGRSCQEMRGTFIVRLLTKQLKQLYKVSTPCLDDHQYKEEELKSF